MLPRHEPFFLADIVSPSGKNAGDISQSDLYVNPEVILRADHKSDIQPVLKKMDEYSQAGKYLAGFLSYEAGCYLNGLDVSSEENFPLIWFGVFSKPEIYFHKPDDTDYYMSPIEPCLDKNEYSQRFHKIKKSIFEGFVYQINYTFPLKFHFFGDREKLFYDLKFNQNAAYNFMIAFEKQSIISLSPELFFYKNGNHILVKPMKGTAARSEDPLVDRENKKNLFESKKNQAENAMITDILRNDLGKICQNGSIKVEHYLEIEEYPTLYQMTSTISGELKKDLNYVKIFSAIFPSASITGAPKLEAMKHIEHLEKQSRGIYTGAIGVIHPDGKAIFNVAIRTLCINGNEGTLNVGSGVVYDSESDSEYEECLLKSKFALVFQKSFYIFETMLFKNGRFVLMDLHMERIKKSARYFLIYFPENEILRELEAVKILLTGKSSHRIKLTLQPEGKFKITHDPIVLHKKTYNLKISKSIINSDNEFVYHKTNFRALFDQEYQEALRQNFDEVLYLNENGYVTECCVHNIIVKIENKWFTPSRSAGLLPGTLREYLIRKSFLTEASLTLSDILNAQSIALINSLRGINKARLIASK